MATISITSAPSAESIRPERFLAAINKMGGPAKSCKFMVTFEPTGGNSQNTLLTNLTLPLRSLIKDDLPYLCESAEMPGRAFETVNNRYYGPSFKMPYQTTYEDINLSFICRSKSHERQFFDDWMNIINPNENYNYNYRKNYSCDINVFLFSDSKIESGVAGSGTNMHVQYYFKLHDAFPVLVNPQPITWADSEFLRLGVSFTYTRWTRPGLDRTSSTTSNKLVSGRNIVAAGSGKTISF